ncbi:MAG: ATP-dependent Clp protease adaptor ClpS [Lachnospiraceae bacterium]|nr:ATP-dependent Clp protease adaptor ClpS [Lachnospiraceae bacterium]
MAVLGSFKEKTKDIVKEPRQYNVIMINDDFTTMEFVVRILVTIFNKDETTAENLMLKVHQSGRAVVAVYPYDIAVSKVNRALREANEEGFPFRMSVEEA